MDFLKKAGESMAIDEDNYSREELEFITFCVENMAEKLSKDSVAIYDAWTEKSNLLYDYIIPCYDILHTQGKEYILDNILDVMVERGIQV